MHSLRASFCLSYGPASKEAGGGQEAGREASQDGRPQLNRGISHIMGYLTSWDMVTCSAAKAGARTGGKCSEFQHLSSQVSWKPCLPGDGCMSACPWEVVNEFLCMPCLCVELFLCLLNCLYLNPCIFSLYPFSCRWEWVREQLCGVWVPTGLTHSTMRSFALVASSLVTWH